MVTLMDISKVKVKVEVPERDIAKLIVGQKVEVRVDPYPGRVFSGKVRRINPAADPMARTFEVEVELPNPDMALRPGMFARVKITVQEKEDVTLVPISSLIEEGGSPQVFVVKGERAYRRPVKLGLRNESYAEVIGLKEGEKVVTVGKENLRDGCRIEVVTERQLKEVGG